MGWVVLPSGTLKRITDKQFAAYAASDRDLPRAFMTGEAHRKPAFDWTEKCPNVRAFFELLSEAKKTVCLCRSPPKGRGGKLCSAFLAGLHGQGRIIGWELPLFEDLHPSMVMSMQLAEQIDALGVQRLSQASKDLLQFEELLYAVPILFATNETTDNDLFEIIAVILNLLQQFRKARATFFERRFEGIDKICNSLL